MRGPRHVKVVEILPNLLPQSALISKHINGYISYFQLPSQVSLGRSDWLQTFVD